MRCPFRVHKKRQVVEEGEHVKVILSSGEILLLPSGGK